MVLAMMVTVCDDRTYLAVIMVLEASRSSMADGLDHGK